MDISRAALPPIQPTTTAAEKAHPRFAEYRSYVAACGLQLIAASEFALWLKETERREWEAKHWEDHCFEVTSPHASMARGWWKNRFAPGHKLAAQFGPFPTRAAAEAA